MLEHILLRHWYVRVGQCLNLEECHYLQQELVVAFSLKESCAYSLVDVHDLNDFVACFKV